MLSSGNSSLWKALNLFLDKFSFLRLGIVDIAANSLLGFTSTESELKLLELRFISSSVLKKLKSLGRVHRSLEAISNTLSLIRYLNSVK